MEFKQPKKQAEDNLELTQDDLKDAKPKEKRHLSTKTFALINLVILVIVGAIGYYLYTSIAELRDENTAIQQELLDNSTKTTESGDDDEATDEPQYKGELRDVTMGKEVRGIQTNGTASGESSASFVDGTYSLTATFSNLPNPQGDEFYEGWVVQRQPFKFISTGKLTKVDGVYTNSFESDVDYTSYDQYVLTIEPNDGDPAPADHIVEGVMTKQ